MRPKPDALLRAAVRLLLIARPADPQHCEYWDRVMIRLLRYCGNVRPPRIKR